MVYIFLNLQEDIGLLDTKIEYYNKPYSLPLSLDYIDFDSCYMVTNDDTINLIITDQCEPEVYQSLFGVNSFKEINPDVEQLTEKENDLNIRVNNLMNQEKTLNKIPQNVKIILVTEKNILSDNITSLLCEDGYKDEPYYVDFLATIHLNIQSMIK